MGPDAMIFIFFMLSFKPTFSLSKNWKDKKPKTYINMEWVNLGVIKYNRKKLLKTELLDCGDTDQMKHGFYFWGAPKSLQMVIAAMKLKDAYLLEGNL